jgi:hypothetical protein
MRVELIFIMLLVSLSSRSQNNSPTEALQMEDFNLAKDCLKEANLNGAMKLFYYANNFNKKTPIGALALKKADSIKVILRKKLLTELVGNWKMIDDVPSWVMREDSVVGQMITINTSEIQFFELVRNAKSWKLTKTEKILYSEEQTMNSSYADLIYSNNEIWYYWIDEKTGYLQAINTGEKTETGRTEIICGSPKKTYFRLQ